MGFIHGGGILVFCSFHQTIPILFTCIPRGAHIAGPYRLPIMGHNNEAMRDHALCSFMLIPTL